LLTLAMAVAVLAAPGSGQGGTPVKRVGSPTELADTLTSSFRGRIVIPRDVDWEMKRACGARDEFGRCVDTPLTFLPLHAGVELVGERGALGSRPTLRATYDAESYPLLHIQEGGVRVEGLHLYGPRRPKDRFKANLPGVKAITVVQDAPNQRDRPTVIADMEIDRWLVGVEVEGVKEVKEPKDYCDTPGCPVPLPTDAGLLRVERSNIHDNTGVGGGYGVVVGGGAYATIEGNVFQFNNHSIAASGYAYSGYVALFNYVLRGVYTFGEDRTLPHSLDVHGTGGSGSSHAGGWAGTYFMLRQNVILGEQDYGFLGRLTRAAFALRGRSVRSANFIGNVVTHDDFDEAIKLRSGDDDSLDEDKPSTFNLRTAGTVYDTDHSTELAAGDFDGDGRTDAFVANGTAWFMSRAGIQPWELLHESTKLTRELAFADVDNDRRTDVLYRDGAGRVGYLRGGQGDLLPLTSTPVPLSELRSGDFDADRLTDLFYTRGGEWRVWSGRTRTWSTVGGSGKPIGELLLGEFDGAPGTDVAGVIGSGWAYSSAARSPWTPMNGRLTKSFAGARAADLDGNGRTDVVVHSSGAWRWSRDARGPLSSMRRAPGYPILAQTLVGRFEGGTRDWLVAFGPAGSVVGSPGDRLAIYRGPRPGEGFQPLSVQSMR
jgi:hypothetical protein